VANAVASVFSDAKTVESPFLNRIGVQPFRAVLARGLYRARGRSADRVAADLARDGIVVVEDFLAPDDFAVLAREAAEHVATAEPGYHQVQGTSDVRHFYLDPGTPAERPTLAATGGDARLLAHFSAAERRDVGVRDVGRIVEDIRFGDASIPDPMTRLHLDTFFHTHKAWIFLHDVGPDEGPFVYVPGSHLLDRVRLGFDYHDSVGENMRSRLVSDEEVARRGLARRPTTCRANSLVIADTCGYHTRSVGADGATRRALHLIVRGNPFVVRGGRAWRG